MRSGSAYRLSHLHHHQHLLTSDDIEGATAHGSLLEAVASGPIAQVKLWFWAWKKYRNFRGQLLLEAIGIVVLLVSACVAFRWTTTPLVYVALVAAGSWLFPLVTVYIPHDGRAKTLLSQTRLFRGTLIQLVAFNHLYHLEHHLYPAVPHHHWKTLAARLDPYFQRSGVIPWKASNTPAK